MVDTAHRETSATNLRCVVVTPEKAILDEPTDFVALPMFDGELGVLPGRLPLIGRLGYGELRVGQGGHVQRYFVDGPCGRGLDDQCALRKHHRRDQDWRSTPCASRGRQRRSDHAAAFKSSVGSWSRVAPRFG